MKLKGCTMKVLDFKDKRFWSLILHCGLPIALQNLILNSVTLIDNVLIGGLGDVNIAAVGIANKMTFIFSVFLFGVNSGVNIFSAQFWGKKDLQGVRKVLGLSLLLSLAISLPFTIFGGFFPQFFIDIFSDDPEVIHQGAVYLRILAFSYPILAVTMAYSIQSRGVGRTRVPLLSSIAALASNALLDYALIYGRFGLPRLEIAGAAIATVIAIILECLVLLGIIYLNKFELAAKPSDFRGYTKDFMMRFIGPVTPVIFNEVLWSIGVTGYTYFYGAMGTEAVATVQILDVINSIFISLFQGLGNATGSITGNLIGSGEDETARVYANRTVITAGALGILTGGLLLLTTPFFLGFFDISDATAAICRKTMFVYAAYMIPKAINNTIIVGICRGGGDTVFAAIIDVCAPWLVGLPMAYLGVKVFALPVYFVMAMINLEELFKVILGLIRIKSGKWLNNLVRDFRMDHEGDSLTNMS